MRRLLLCATLLLAATGCEPDGPLTKQEKTAWKKKRKEVADYPYMVAGYDARARKWMVRCFVDFKLHKYAWKEHAVDLWSRNDPDSPLNLAHKVHTEAENRDIAVTAVIDLVSNESPTVSWWYYKDGEVIKRSTAAPRADLEASLREYLLGIQKNPEIVKPPAYGDD